MVFIYYSVDKVQYNSGYVCVSNSDHHISDKLWTVVGPKISQVSRIIKRLFEVFRVGIADISPFYKDFDPFNSFRKSVEDYVTPMVN